MKGSSWDFRLAWAPAGGGGTTDRLQCMEAPNQKTLQKRPGSRLARSPRAAPQGCETQGPVRPGGRALGL